MSFDKTFNSSSVSKKMIIKLKKQLKILACRIKQLQTLGCLIKKTSGRSIFIFFYSPPFGVIVFV